MSNVLSDWTFNGVHLSSFGAVTRLDSYLDMPPKRGDNILIPMAHGKTWVPKFYDTRIVSFGIEVIGTSIIDLEQKMDALKLLLGVRTQEILSNMFCEGPRIAWAEVLNQLGGTRDPDPLVASVVLDFLLADPFFRASVLTSDTKTIDASPKIYALHNPGTAEERKAIITLTGPLNIPTITNTTNGVVLQYNGVLAAITDIVTIDCGLFTAVDETAAVVLDKIIHTGDSTFMAFVPGDNILSVADGTATTGTVKIEFYPPYL